MAGTIGVIAEDLARYTIFTSSLTRLHKPPNTYILFATGSERAANRERIVRDAITIGSEWVWFIDDDHGFDDMALLKLLAHDVPVVGSFYLQRGAPFYPIAYVGRDQNGWWPLDLTQCPEHGLVGVDAVGAGGLLVRTEVFHELKEPWFQYTHEMSEDLFFCRRVREELDLQIYLDLDVKLSHLRVSAIVPTYDESWVAGISFGPGASVTMPILPPVTEEKVS